MFQPKSVICISILSWSLSDPLQDIHYNADSLYTDGRWYYDVQVHAAYGLLIWPISQTAANNQQQ